MFARVVSILALGTTSFAIQDGSREFAAEALEADLQTQASASFLRGLEADLVKLRLQLRRTTSRSFLQLAAGEAPTKKEEADAAEAMKQMAVLGPKNFPAMAELMHGMYDTWKDKISEANKREQEQKTDLEKTMGDLEKKKKATLALATDKESRKDATETYDRMERYWKKQRAISHRQYHTALKILHSGMQKFKGVMGALSDAGAGKKPSAKDLQAIGVLPEVALLQTKLADILDWAAASTKELASQ